MSFPRYKRYKNSGVEWLGDVPKHWHIKRLKHVCHVFPSNVDKKAQEGEPPVLLCNYTDVYYSERITPDVAFMAATASPDQIAKFTLRAGDTVVTKDSETASDIAVASYVPQDLPGVICGYHLSIVRPREGTFGSFVKRLFDSTYAKSRFAVAANGLTRFGLSQYALDNVDMPFPLRPEQATIADFLDRETAKIDALIAEQQRLIELLKEKRQAVISHAITKGLSRSARTKDSGIEWLGDVPEHWNVKRIKRLIHSIEQGWSPQCEGYPVQAEEEWGVLKVGCVNGGKFNARENKALPASLDPIPALAIATGDILISRANTRELVGRAAAVEIDYPRLMLCDKLYRLKAIPRLCLAKFIVFYLGTDMVRRRIELAATGASSSMLNIGQSTILDLEIGLPPLDEQATIIATIDREIAKIDSLTAEAQTAITLLQERRTALISAAVTGKIDIRGLAASNPIVVGQSV